MKKYIFLIIFVGLMVYLPSLSNGFVWDDEELIVNNPIIHSLSNIPLTFKGSLFNTGGAGFGGFYYRPLMTLSFIINYALSGGQPFLFHLFQLTIHLLNGALLFLLLKYIFKKDWLAGILALIFVIHPGISEAVFYIASTQEVLFTFFSLLSFLALIKVKNLSLLMLAEVFLILLALLSKETAIILIPLLIIFSYFFKKDKLLPLISGLIFGVSIYFFSRLVIAGIGFDSFKNVPIAKASISEKILTIPVIIFSYLRLIFFPKDLAIAQQFVIKSPTDSRFLINIIFNIIFCFLIIKSIKKNHHKNLLFFLSWFLLPLFLVLNIIPLDMTIAERWLYFPMIGMLGIGGVVINIFFERSEKFSSRYARTIKIFSVIIILSLSIRTFIRGFNWKNGLSLYSHDITYAKDSFDLNNNLGVELFRKGKINEAKPFFEQSIKLNPDWWIAYNNLGTVYLRENNIKKAESLYRASLQRSDYYVAIENLAGLLFKNHREKEAITFCNSYLKKLPNNLTLRTILSFSYYKIGEFVKSEEEANVIYLIQPSEDNQALVQAIKQRKLKL